MFEYAEGDMDEFSHDGADDAHFGFAGGAKSGSEVTQRRIDGGANLQPSSSA